MKINSISGLVYRVSDLGKTVEFYESLGFRTGKQDSNRVTCYINWFWVTFVQADGASIEPETGSTLYLKVDDLDEFYGAVLAQGHVAETEPRRQGSGVREFLLLDPDGYRLAFFAKK